MYVFARTAFDVMYSGTRLDKKHAVVDKQKRQQFSKNVRHHICLQEKLSENTALEVK